MITERKAQSQEQPKQQKRSAQKEEQDIVLYSTGCPKCNVLKKKLDGKGIPYTENHSMEDMTTLGIMSAPGLKVGDKLMNFVEANQWVNAQEIDQGVRA